jgi:hypothetical protein
MKRSEGFQVRRFGVGVVESVDGGSVVRSPVVKGTECVDEAANGGQGGGGNPGPASPRSVPPLEATPRQAPRARGEIFVCAVFSLYREHPRELGQSARAGDLSTRQGPGRAYWTQEPGARSARVVKSSQKISPRARGACLGVASSGGQGAAKRRGRAGVAASPVGRVVEARSSRNGRTEDGGTAGEGRNHGNGKPKHLETGMQCNAGAR